jgi:hypothetical protein
MDSCRLAKPANPPLLPVDELLARIRHQTILGTRRPAGQGRFRRKHEPCRRQKCRNSTDFGHAHFGASPAWRGQASASRTPLIWLQGRLWCPPWKLPGPLMAILTLSSIRDAGSFHSRKLILMATQRVFAQRRFASRAAFIRIPSCFRNAAGTGPSQTR